MRHLIVSDIHANWEALEAVLQSAAGAYDQIICLGDLVGYGGDPNRVVDWARTNVAVVVRGNHDRACVGLDDLEWFNPVARIAAAWTQRELSRENTDYVLALPKGPLAVDGFQVMHGSPLDEDEYVVGISDAQPVFSYLESAVAFFGHTHLQGGFCWRSQSVQKLAKPHPRQQHQLPLELDPDCAYLINPGSVGQPRDGDARAAYVLYHPEERCLCYYRLPYDIAAAQAKIRRAGLPDALAARLAFGR